MRWKQLAWTAVLVLLAALVLDWRSARRMQPVTEAINRLSIALERLEGHVAQGTQHAEYWYDDHGTPKIWTVDTTRLSGESVADWNARFASDIATAHALHAPI